MKGPLKKRGTLARLYQVIRRHPRLALVAAVLYLILPTDLIPEALTGPMGLLDDAAILLLPILALIAEAREKKASQPPPTRQTLTQCPRCKGYRVDANAPCPHCA